MASVVIILSGVAVYQLHKKHQAKKALRLESEQEAAFATEHARVMQQLEHDRSSVYSGNTLTNEARDKKGLARSETRDSTTSLSKGRRLREKLGGWGGRRGLRLRMEERLKDTCC